MAMLYNGDNKTVAYDKLAALRMQVFWPNNKTGSLLIDRHVQLVKYTDARMSGNATSDAVQFIANSVFSLDKQIEKLSRVDIKMEAMSKYTMRMVDSIHAGKYADAVVAVKGIIYTLP
jgi:hypothetical protein